MSPIWEGPDGLHMDQPFSTEPFTRTPEIIAHLDVIELPNEPPILMRPLLRPFLQNLRPERSEILSPFVAQIREVRYLCFWMAQIGSLN
jgi:hypothetical protein